MYFERRISIRDDLQSVDISIDRSPPLATEERNPTRLSFVKQRVRWLGLLAVADELPATHGGLGPPPIDKKADGPVFADHEMMTIAPPH
ncbi:MAG: hypothetical protein GWN87_29765 [Desulfuromonadales bacterium]|nr:hypothetical protein [Desulfuromonadales bacterium]